MPCHVEKQKRKEQDNWSLATQQGSTYTSTIPAKAESSKLKEEDKVKSVMKKEKNTEHDIMHMGSQFDN
ncbi:hypothetical protein MN608_02875 [Microdochium nivale]|nr:hypothetical protein MN608_02875 [Microdochium nivale]